MTSLLLRDALVVPMDGPSDAPVGSIRRASIRIDAGTIASIDPELVPLDGERVLDCSGLTAFPGFVQGHLHYCQTLFRGLADDLPLLEWLHKRIWPFEAAHDAASTRASAELSVVELLRGGTTTTQVMESVRYAEESFEVAARTGMTTILGNCLMDQAPDGPTGFVTSQAEALRISEELCNAFHGQGRLQYAVSPRFLLSCSDGLGRAAAEFAVDRGLRIHTHAGEHPAEVEAVREATGTDYLLALDARGLLGPRTGLAHCVHLSEAEVACLQDRGAAVLHCPSTNLKLGSGIAPVAFYFANHIPLAIGADGAPCNNRLSALTELRQAALLQCAVFEPGAWPAADALYTLTRGGALALGLGDELGSLEVGKRADVALLDLESYLPGGDPVSRLVWSASDADVRHVVVGGTLAVEAGRVAVLDASRVTQNARVQRDAALRRAGFC